MCPKVLLENWKRFQIHAESNEKLGAEESNVLPII